MSVITPSSDLYLIRSPLEADMKHQLDFANEEAQFTYFTTNLDKKYYDEFTYIRKDNMIKVNECIDDILTYNYIIYRNESYGSKWFYAFITRMEYVNNETTAIYFSLDVWQTWQFNLVLRRSFVEREHVDDDSVGLHTIDENLGTGEYVINSVTDKTICEPTANGSWIAMAVTEVPTNSQGTSILPSAVTSRMYNGIIQGCYLLLFEYNTTGIESLSNVITWYDSKMKKDAIVSLYALPKNIYDSNHTMSLSYNDPFVADIFWFTSNGGASDLGSTTLTRNTTLNGYTPKNNKMYCFPTNYIMVTNNYGINNVYHWEDFTNTASATFNYRGVVTEGSSVKAFPTNYKKNSTANSGFAYGIDLGNTPTFSWLSDFYLNWQAQNGIASGQDSANNLVNAFNNVPEGDASPKNALQYFGGLVEAGVEHLGATINIVKNALGTHQAKMTPDQVNGQSTGDLNFAIGKCGFTYYQISVRAEVARVIDDYYSMFGYKVNAMKVPNLKSRTNWNYVKLVDANFLGNIPQDDMQALKSIFYNGITIWHNPSTFLDYSQTNSIVV